ncbi:zinc finger protein 726-like [Manduca sexta]|uniref:zinc finger protein 726-like n=1 Tax=Manduca sexta TaxID=7130 RepID=UPI001182B4E5|nr:zinc finger protein 726-like [Manduca sexta]
MSGKRIKKTFSKQCRICLKAGEIPIYGEDCHSDLSFDVRIFGDIDMSEDDEYPKHLCEQCHKLLQCAILFRSTAQKSDMNLREPKVKCEFTSDDSSEPALLENNSIKAKQYREPTQTSSVFDYFSDVFSDDGTQENKIVKCRSKSRISKVQCRVCRKIITKAYYKEHYALHDPAIAKYICDICGKSFRQRSAHVTHRFTHSTEFKFKCKVCPYRGRSSGLLKTHLRIHTGDYKYMCSECPARFLTKSNLNRHALKHKDPQFKCDTCKRAFHLKLTLERHIEAIHRGIKNHVCDFCGKAFGYRKALMQHERDVHKREKKSHGRAPAYLQAEDKKQHVEQ